MSINMTLKAAKLELPTNEKIVLWCLCDHYNDNSKLCYPSTKRIQKFTGLSARTVHRVIAKLSERGVISVIKRSGTSSSYSINIDYIECKAVTESHQCQIDTCDIAAVSSDRESQGVVTESHRGSDRESHKPVNKPVTEPVNKTKGVYCSKFEKIWDISRDSYKSTKSELGSKKKAHDEYKKLKPSDELIDLIIRSLVKQKDQKVRSARLNEFYPPFQHLERWLKNRRWEDEVMENIAQPSGRDGENRRARKILTRDDF